MLFQLSLTDNKKKIQQNRKFAQRFRNTFDFYVYYLFLFNYFHAFNALPNQRQTNLWV